MIESIAPLTCFLTKPLYGVLFGDIDHCLDTGGTNILEENLLFLKNRLEENLLYKTDFDIILMLSCDCL